MLALSLATYGSDSFVILHFHKKRLNRSAIDNWKSIFSVQPILGTRSITDMLQNIGQKSTLKGGISFINCSDLVSQWDRDRVKSAQFFSWDGKDLIKLYNVKEGLSLQKQWVISESVYRLRCTGMTSDPSLPFLNPATDSWCWPWVCCKLKAGGL